MEIKISTAPRGGVFIAIVGICLKPRKKMIDTWFLTRSEFQTSKITHFEILTFNVANTLRRTVLMPTHPSQATGYSQQTKELIERIVKEIQ